MEKEDFYKKSVVMCQELDLAGNFIYQGIQTFDRIENFDVLNELFLFLYNISVGIERLQKIVLFLFSSNNNFEIKIHDHSKLHQKIIEIIKKNNLDKKETKFLAMISLFYSKYRYNRFEDNSSLEEEKSMLLLFIEEHGEMIFDTGLFGIVFNTDRTKNFISKIICSISHKYYNLIEKQSRELNIFSYELNSSSPAFLIFCESYSKESRIKNYDLQNYAVKELILYLVNNKEQSTFLKFLESIEPLSFDVEMLQEHLINFLQEKNIELIDEVEYLYGEMEESVREDRLELLKILFSKTIYFDEDEIET